MSMRKPVFPSRGASTGAPYSPGIELENLVFTSGQVPLDPATGKILDAPFADQVRLTLDNVEAVLSAAGTSLAKAVKVTIFVTDMTKFGELNEIYKTFFQADPPARSCIEVSRLPFDSPVEIEAIALK